MKHRLDSFTAYFLYLGENFSITEVATICVRVDFVKHFSSFLTPYIAALYTFCTWASTFPLPRIQKCVQVELVKHIFNFSLNK